MLFCISITAPKHNLQTTDRSIPIAFNDKHPYRYPPYVTSFFNQVWITEPGVAQCDCNQIESKKFAQKMLNFVITAHFAFNLHRVVFSCNATLNSSC